MCVSTRTVHTNLFIAFHIYFCSILFRYQLFLQVKQDVLQGRLPISFELAAELGAFIVQCKYKLPDTQLILFCRHVVSLGGCTCAIAVLARNTCFNSI